MFDLHIHSRHSDGTLSVPEIAAIIKKKGLAHCSLVDHNTVAGIRELEACLAGSGTIVIPGTELTAKDNEDEVHLLAYDFDLDVVARMLHERDEIVRRQKIEEVKAAIPLFQKEGFTMTDGLAPVEKKPASLTTALDICAHRENQELFRKRHGKELTPEDFFWVYQAPNKSCAVKRAGVTIAWVVEQFHTVARDLIIAHPFVSVSVVVKPLTVARLHDLLKRGVTGIEVYHNQTTIEQIQLLKKIVREHGLSYTGGSDFHGKPADTPIGQYGAETVIPSFRLSRHRGD